MRVEVYGCSKGEAFTSNFNNRSCYSISYLEHKKIFQSTVDMYLSNSDAPFRPLCADLMESNESLQVQNVDGFSARGLIYDVV